MSSDIVNRMKRTLASRTKMAKPAKGPTPSRGLLSRRPPKDGMPQEDDQLQKIAGYVQELRSQRESMKNGR